MTKRAVVSACALAAGLCVSVASADLTDDVFTVRATNQDGATGFVTIHIDDGYWDDDGNYHWNQGDPLDIMSDGGAYLGTLSNASVEIIKDPVINLNFNVQASNQNTIFQIDSGILSFAQISSPIGAASAGVTVTDVNGNGATISPDGPSMYLASYDEGLGSAGDFAALLGSAVSAGAFGSASASEEFPGGGGYVPVGQPIENMIADWTFTVTAGDLASGTSTYVVVPAPAGLGLLGLGGLAVARRRR